MPIKFSKEKYKKFRFLSLLKLKKNKLLVSRKYFFFKYCILRKNILFYKKNCFLFLKKNWLFCEINEINFGFGDSETPRTDTIFLIENYIIKFILHIICSLCYISFWKTTKRPVVGDLLFLFRKDVKKCKKIEYLLKMKTLIQKIIESDKKVKFGSKKMKIKI